MGVIVGSDTRGLKTTHRNQNLVGKLVFWVHFLSSNNPRKTHISQECFGALKSDEIMRTTTFGIKHLVSDLSDEDTGAQSQVLMALSLEFVKNIRNYFFRLFAAIFSKQ